MIVSVVIPARDDAPMLARCLDALGRQTGLPDDLEVEIVVVDNGSTDATAAVAREAGARVIEEPIAGIPRAASAGYDAARGELIARVDADSICPPDWLARAIAIFAHDDELSVLTGTGEFYGASELVHRIGKAWYLGGMYWSMTGYLGHPPIFGSNFVMRSEVWRQLRAEVHRSQRTIHDDLDLSLHIKPWMTVRYDPDFVVQISARPFATFSGFRRRLSWVLPTLRNHWPDDSPWNRRAARRRWEEHETGEGSRPGHAA
ncbi:glycosyltransferase [Lysinimonas soli]|uniref:4,4'-diaponeurosporenoate glycosyltransferase n=1 Tax=Lysinimonas soli TaxID=1074233 RepID=A0ABW0NLJ3_9MICO